MSPAMKRASEETPIFPTLAHASRRRRLGADNSHGVVGMVILQVAAAVADGGGDSDGTFGAGGGGGDGGVGGDGDGDASAGRRPLGVFRTRPSVGGARVQRRQWLCARRVRRRDAHDGDRVVGNSRRCRHRQDPRQSRVYRMAVFSDT